MLEGCRIVSEGWGVLLSEAILEVIIWRGRSRCDKDVVEGYKYEVVGR